jgi:hypothetical protein
MDKGEGGIGNRGRGGERVHTSDIIQHTQPQQRICKAQDRTRHDW